MKHRLLPANCLVFVMSWLIAMPVSLGVEATASTKGDCSQAFAYVEVKGNLTINCSAHNHELKSVYDLLIATRKEQKLNKAQMRALVQATNIMLSSVLNVEGLSKDSNARIRKLQASVDTMERYRKNNGNDATLAAVLLQYKSLKHATEMFEQLSQSTNYKEKYQMASEVLDILSSNLKPVITRDDLPSKPLILPAGTNTFRVLFNVPARIPPRLEFNGLPPGTQAQVIENSEFGFTVIFLPLSIPVETFGFIGDARI